MRGKRRIMLMLALAVFLMAGMMSVKAAETANFQLESTVVDGQVEVAVKAVNLKKVAVVQLTLAYDVNDMTFVDGDTTTGVDGAMVAVGEETKGLVRIAYIDGEATDIDANGSLLATVKFTVNDGVTDSVTPVTLVLEELYATGTTDTTLNRALAENAEVRETYGDPSDVTALVPAEDVEITLSNAVMGDVTGDGEVTADDAAFVLQYVVGGELTTTQMDVADVTGDGEVTADDAAYILKYVIGAINAFN